MLGLVPGACNNMRMSDHAPRRPKCPRNVNHFATALVDVATDAETETVSRTRDWVTLAAAELRRRRCLKGGRARSNIVKAGQRSTLARRVAAKSWKTDG